MNKPTSNLQPVGQAPDLLQVSNPPLCCAYLEAPEGTMSLRYVTRHQHSTSTGGSEGLRFYFPAFQGERMQNSVGTRTQREIQVKSSKGMMT